MVKEQGIKNDNDKAMFNLILPEFEKAVAEVLTYGAKKYSPNNWQHVDDGLERYYAALRRHLCAWREGEEIDEESGLSHLAHVATNIMFIMYFAEEEK